MFRKNSFSSCLRGIKPWYHTQKKNLPLVHQINHFRSISTKEVPHDVIRHLFQSVNSEKGIEEYMKIYGTPGVSRTALIKIGGEVLDNELNVLVKSLNFLKKVGLVPIIIHGAGPQMNAELEKLGEYPEYVGGMRVTTPSTMSVAIRVFHEANTKLVDALLRSGEKARPITSGVFEAQFKDKENLGLVGEVSNIHDSTILNALELNQIPVLSCMGQTVDGQLLNINADVAARELAIQLKPHKTIFINAKGGWIEDDGTKLATINMQRDYERMASRDYTGRQGTLLKLNEIKLLLDALPRTSSVVLTSASELAREIVSSSSSGTVCVRGEYEDPEGTHSPQKSGKFKVGILGARGYVGREVIRLVGKHPKLDLVCASSRSLVGQTVLDIAKAPPLNPHSNLPAASVDNSCMLEIDPELEFSDLSYDNIRNSAYASEVDVWILALPNGFSAPYVEILKNLEKSPVLIDLSADHRFNSEWVYGLPENQEYKSLLRKHKLISNPGCYATGSQLGLLPLVSPLAEERGIELNPTIPPHIFGVSGYSGAGTGLSSNNDLEVLKGNIVAYKSINHIHEKEISHHLKLRTNFMPHVASFFQGIHLTISANLNTKNISEHDVFNLYESYYKNDTLVNVVTDIPHVRDNAKHHHVTIGGFQIDEKTGRLVLISTIDNLLKGAATQAIQNINLALEIDELTGIHDEF